MSSRTIVPRGATAPRFELRDQVRVTQGAIRDKYADWTGIVSGVSRWSTGWMYEVRFETVDGEVIYGVLAERELVAETAVEG